MHLYRNVKMISHSKKRTTYKWDRESVEVPRCRQWYRAHFNALLFSYGAAALLFLIAVAGCALTGWEPTPLVAGILVVAGILPGALVFAWERMKNVRG